MLKPKKLFPSLFVLLAFLIGFVISSYNTSPFSDGELSVHFLDVGQGDCEVILLPNGETMVIDSGNNKDEDFICDYIKSLDVSAIDYLVGTHPHADHIGSLDAIIYNFPVKNIYLPDAFSDSATYLDVLKAIDENNLTITYTSSDTILYSDDTLSITAVAPSKSYDDLNNQSIVIRLTYGKSSFLFTGDAEEESENDITSTVSADVLKVGHHGSRTSTSQSFLERVDPMYAVISCGSDNKYGHPHAETLETLENDSVTVYRTDTMGTLICRTNGNGPTDYRWEMLQID